MCNKIFLGILLGIVLKFSTFLTTNKLIDFLFNNTRSFE